MKKVIDKVCKVLSVIYGYGIMICLFAGGFTFFGYIAALLIGGDTATQICTVIYKEIFPIIITAASVIVLLGVVKMYLSGEVALSIEKKKNADKKRKEQRQNSKENSAEEKKEKGLPVEEKVEESKEGLNPEEK